MKTKRPTLVLWGRLPGGPWLKLSSNGTQAEYSRRTRAGWQCLRLAAGQSPSP